jgi:hypothetical protein
VFEERKCVTMVSGAFPPWVGVTFQFAGSVDYSLLY